MAPVPKRLTAAAEASLVARSRAGDRAALASLLAALDPLVVDQARRFRGLGVAIDDLAQEGRLKLTQCLAGFDPARGVRFSTYATRCVRHRCREVVLDAGATVRIGRDEQREAWRAGGEADANLQRARRSLSGDATVRTGSGEEGRATLFDRLVSPADDPERALDRASLAVAVRTAVRRLGAQQRAVIEALWLSTDADGDDRRKAEVGRAEGVSRARVWQVERSAMERLREMMAELRAG